MICQKNSALLALLLISSPMTLSASQISESKRAPSISAVHGAVTQRASLRRMQHLLAAAPMLQLKAEKPPEQAPLDAIVEYAKENCLNEGTLRKVDDYVYLKLNEEYLSHIFNMIKDINPHVRMPHFFNGTGPHISVIRDDEWTGIPPRRIAEVGNQYLFTPVRVDIVMTPKNKKLWVLVVKPSDELVEFRKQYVDGTLPYGHEFHITMAEQFD